MTKILNFYNEGGTYNDNSESVITISPEGTRVEQHITPVPAPEQTTETRKETVGSGLTIGQQVLLFSELLGVALDSTYGNPNQLSDLIARVTGGNKESIRQKIMQIGKMKNYGKQVKADAAMVAAMLEPYKPDLASDLINFYVDD